MVPNPLTLLVGLPTRTQRGTLALAEWTSPQSPDTTSTLSVSRLDKTRAGGGVMMNEAARVDATAMICSDVAAGCGGW